jgi:hypothetical protein
MRFDGWLRRIRKANKGSAAQVCCLAVNATLGHTKIENTVRYLGVDVEDALEPAEATEV